MGFFNFKFEKLPGKKAALTTVAALGSMLGSHAAEVGKPATSEKTETTANYATVDNYVADKAAHHVNHEVLTNEDFTMKKDSIEKDGHVYKVEITYDNGAPYQYRFTDKDKATGVEIETVDGGFSEHVHAPMTHKEVYNEKAGAYTDVIGGGDRDTIVKPSGKPEKIWVRYPNGSSMTLELSRGTWKAATFDHKGNENVGVTPAQSAVDGWVEKAMNIHALIPLKFQRESSKMASSSNKGAKGTAQK